jgi:hypothetical protein
MLAVHPLSLLSLLAVICAQHPKVWADSGQRPQTVSIRFPSGFSERSLCTDHLLPFPETIVQKASEALNKIRLRQRIKKLHQLAHYTTRQSQLQLEPNLTDGLRDQMYDVFSEASEQELLPFAMELTVIAKKLSLHLARQPGPLTLAYQVFLTRTIELNLAVTWHSQKRRAKTLASLYGLWAATNILDFTAFSDPAEILKESVDALASAAEHEINGWFEAEVTEHFSLVVTEVLRSYEHLDELAKFEVRKAFSESVVAWSLFIRLADVYAHRNPTIATRLKAIGSVIEKMIQSSNLKSFPSAEKELCELLRIVHGAHNGRSRHLH